MRKMPLNQIAFGKTDAFNELNTFGQEYFMESFVANPKYHIDDFLSGSRFFVCGKKGTGKSALLKYLECHFLNVDLMVEINHIISEYVQIEQATDGITLSRQFDISKIDFDLLRREFAKAKKKNLIMKDLQELIRVRLDAMLFNNPDRIKYHERYQEIIEDYNSQQDRANIEKTFDELMDLVQNMDQEERRYVREGFSSDEELSLYDMLFSENLSKQDIQKIKKVAVDLLQKVKSKIAELDHWTDKQETKATIDTLIRDTLWLELPECYDELRISEYRQRIYEYVYTRYKGVA